MNSPTRRQQTVVDKSLQYRLILRIGGIGACYFVAGIAVACVIPVVFSSLFVTPAEAVARAALRLGMVLQVVLLPLALTVFGLWMHGIRETLKIAGPNLRFRRAFERMRRLDLPRSLRLREGDYQRETAEALEAALAAWRAELGRIRSEHATLARHLNAARQSGRPGDLHPVSDASARLAASLERFTLHDELVPAMRELPVEPMVNVVVAETPA